jgi:two-component system capsular synthesis sensor histidine kinase RcsC
VIFLISDVIQFTKIKSLQQIKLLPQEINLREIVNFGHDILTSLLMCSKAKSIAIQPALEFDDNIDNMNIKADEIRLKQIIVNILSNAVKFTKSGLILIKCSIVTVKKIVLVRITDTGIGIPDNEQENILGDLKMMNNETVHNYKGKGLGLSICKSLASSMNIELSASSIYGIGSEFSLAIPYISKSVISIPGHKVFNEVNSSMDSCQNDSESQIQIKEIKNIKIQMQHSVKASHPLGFDIRDKRTTNQAHVKFSN